MKYNIIIYCSSVGAPSPLLTVTANLLLLSPNQTYYYRLDHLFILFYIFSCSVSKCLYPRKCGHIGVPAMDLDLVTAANKSYNTHHLLHIVVKEQQAAAAAAKAALQPRQQHPQRVLPRHNKQTTPVTPIVFVALPTPGCSTS